MRISILLLAFILGVCGNAQSVKGELTLNGKSEIKLELETNSAVQLFKDFITDKYQLKFAFSGVNLVKNVYKEEIVFFTFKTIIKKDGKIIKNIIRKHPIPYFPGDMMLPAPEAFDFISALSLIGENEKYSAVPTLNERLGTMPEGNYTVQLQVEPIGVKGEIKPLEFSFLLRKRPGRL